MSDSKQSEAKQSPLAQTLQLPCGVTLKNRIAKAAMTEGLANINDNATQKHINIYRQWAHGGAGLLITGNVMVDRRFLERPGNVVVEDEGGLKELEKWAAAATENDTHCWVQISHPGRQCARIVSSQPLSASDVQLNILKNFARPRAMTKVEIKAAIKSYANTARIVKKAGFSGVQIHAAHGYLINQFLSPVTNLRSDEYGGSLENRARFLLEIVAAVREEVGANFPVAVKLNSADFQKGGFEFSDSATVATWLEEANIDLLEISGGVYEQLSFLGQEEKSQAERESTKKREAYFLHYATSIREKVNIPIMVTGGFRNVSVMESAISEDSIGIIGIGRPLCTVPGIPNQVLEGQSKILPNEAVNFRLGPGFLAGNSSNNTIRALNSQGNVAWYYRQILRLAKLKQPFVSNNIIVPLVLHFLREYRIGILRRLRFIALFK